MSVCGMFYLEIGAGFGGAEPGPNSMSRVIPYVSLIRPHILTICTLPVNIAEHGIFHQINKRTLKIVEIPPRGSR